MSCAGSTGTVNAPGAAPGEEDENRVWMRRRDLSGVNGVHMYFSKELTGAVGEDIFAHAELKVVPAGDAPQPSADIVRRLKNFTNKFCSVLGTGSMLKSATYYAYTVVCEDESEAVTVSATSASIPSDVTVTVSQVSEESRVESAACVFIEGRANPAVETMPLGALPLKTPLQFDDMGCVTFRINGKLFSFGSETPLRELLDEVSGDMDAMCAMEYDPARDRFVITADGGGRNSYVEIANLSGNVFGRGGAFGIDNGFYVNGQNTIAEINGFRVEYESREYHHKGLLFTFNAPTPREGIRFTVTRDYDATLHAIRQFVSELCELTVVLREDGDPALAELADELAHALLTQEGGTGGTAQTFGILAENTGEKMPLPIQDMNRVKMNLMLNTEEIVALFSNNADGEEMGIVHKIKECIGKFLAGCRHSSSEANAAVAEMEGRIDGLIEDYRKRYSEMQTAALIMEHQREVISTLFDI